MRERSRLDAETALTAAGATPAEVAELWQRVCGAARALALVDFRGRGDTYGRAARAVLDAARGADAGSVAA